jgi:DNA-directed RNA polymerase specialized sigma24 family protein
VAMQRMQPDEVIAAMRIRQWVYEKARIKNGRTTHISPRGWQARRQREFDARIVYVLDIERAMGMLNPTEQTLIIARYRDRLTEAEMAVTAGCSTRKITYALPAAMRHFAQILDRLDLL